MGRIFLLALFPLTVLLFTLHARAEGFGANSEPGPVRLLLQRPEPQKSIAEPPLTAEKDGGNGEERDSEAEAPTGSEIGETERHHSEDEDKSVAGGEVIIGGLVTAVFAAVFCYIRVTRRRHDDNLG